MATIVTIRRFQTEHSGIDAILDLSSRLSQDPLLVQGSSGSISTKENGTLWIKAAGRWLAHADRGPILVPVKIEECLNTLKAGGRNLSTAENSSMNRLRPPADTFMHAVLRDRVVLHLNSVNVMAWAVRQDAPEQLEQRLWGLKWRWIPYVPSCPLLARRLRGACRRGPQPEIFILGNNGLLICGEDCGRVEDLLEDVERRLAAPPRIVAQANYSALEHLASISGWFLPTDPAVHTLGTDGVSRRISQGGILYPRQAAFLGLRSWQVSRQGPLSVIKRQIARVCKASHFLVVERSGVLQSNGIDAEEEATLRGHAELVRRIEASASIRYLTKPEIKGVLEYGGYTPAVV